MTTNPVIHQLGPGEAAEYDAYVEGRADATCHHLRGWSAVAEHSYGIRSVLLGARDDARRLSGVLPLFVVKRPFGKYVTSGLFGAYGPILADAPETAGALLEAAARFADREGAEHLHLKVLGEVTPPPTFRRQDLWVIAELPLPGDPGALFRSIGTAMRTKVRKAQRSGLEIARGHAELDAFYDVLAENMHRKGSPIYGVEFMREILRAFGPKADVVTLRLGGRAVSGALTVEHGGTVYVPFASSRPWAFKLKPNNLLWWEIMSHASAEGARRLDFGTSLRGSSALEFKLGWGAQTRPVSSLVHARSGSERVSLMPSRRTMDAVTNLWRHMPRPFADWLGPQVSAFIV